MFFISRLLAYSHTNYLPRVSATNHTRKGHTYVASSFSVMLLLLIMAALFIVAELIVLQMIGKWLITQWRVYSTVRHLNASVHNKTNNACILYHAMNIDRELTEYRKKSNRCVIHCRTSNAIGSRTAIICI